MAHANPPSSKASLDSTKEETENIADDASNPFPSFKRLKTGHLQLATQQRKLIIILERSQLETMKKGTGSAPFDLLQADKHAKLLAQMKRKPELHPRPDITHQCLLMLQDSVLNRAGLLQVFLHTESNVLIEVNPQTRIPRSYDRFAGLMVQLLHKLSIQADNKNQKLLRVIRNPVTDHLPVGCHRYLTSYQAGESVHPRTLCTDGPVVFVVGAIAHGSVKVDYTEKSVALSRYPMSAAWTCSKVIDAFEEAWKVEDN